MALMIAFAYDESDEATRAKLDRVMDAFEKLTLKCASKVEAWKRFCGEIGVPPGLPEVLGGGERLAAPMAIAREIAAGIADSEPEPELVEKEIEAFQEYWSNLVAKLN